MGSSGLAQKRFGDLCQCLRLLEMHHVAGARNDETRRAVKRMAGLVRIEPGFQLALEVGLCAADEQNRRGHALPAGRRFGPPILHGVRQPVSRIGAQGHGAVGILPGPVTGDKQRALRAQALGTTT